jgi:hypothetical protein
VGLLAVPTTVTTACDKSGAQLTFDKPFSQKNFSFVRTTTRTLEQSGLPAVAE